MSKVENIPAPAVRRLSLYLRQLEILRDADRPTISSRELGEALGVSDAQVRKDLAYFGQFGHPGVGYRIPELISRVRRILGTDKKSNVLLVGAGNLGRALVAFRGFLQRGFEVVAVFDKDPALIGSELPGPGRLHIQPLSEMAAAVREHGIRMGILAVPAIAAQGVAEEMVAAGVRGILNFAPVSLQVGLEIGVASVDLGVHLEQLSFQLTIPSLPMK
jgi:redox-sensing transcriptional repressor